MYWDVTDVTVHDHHKLFVRFEDGLEGWVTCLPTLFSGAFAPLQHPNVFNQVQVIDGALTWPNGADLAPDAMHHAITQTGEWVLD
jgi:hypothetical protein